MKFIMNPLNGNEMSKIMPPQVASIPPPSAGSEPTPRQCRPGTINLRSSAFICGSFFAGALDINYCEFIKVWASPKSSPQSHHIPPISSSKHGTLLSERRLIAARKTKYAFLQLFNSKTDKTGDNENI
jgi:hypothetical protein